MKVPFVALLAAALACHSFCAAAMQLSGAKSEVFRLPHHPMQDIKGDMADAHSGCMHVLYRLSVCSCHRLHYCHTVHCEAISAWPLQESVVVEFFEESLCPFCASFSTKILGPLLNSNLTPYIDFNLVPYGNAKQTSKV